MNHWNVRQWRFRSSGDGNSGGVIYAACSTSAFHSSEIAVQAGCVTIGVWSKADWKSPPMLPGPEFRSRMIIVLNLMGSKMKRELAVYSAITSVEVDVFSSLGRLHNCSPQRL